MKKFLFFLLILFWGQLYGGYSDSGLYGDGKTITHKEMLDTYMKELLTRAKENDPSKNPIYQTQKQGTISYGKAYWLAAKDDEERKKCEKYLLALKAPTHLRKSFPYKDISAEPLFTTGLFGVWKNP